MAGRSDQLSVLQVYDNVVHRPIRGVGCCHAYSRNKLAIAIYLCTHEGQRNIHRLISVSDMVAENFSVSVTKRLGVDHEDCQAITQDSLNGVNMRRF